MLHCSVTGAIATAVVGPNSLFREGLKGILHPPYQVETVAEAIDCVQKIVDLKLIIIVADGNSSALLAQVRRAKQENAEARLVVMSDSDKAEVVWPLLAAGANGYLLRNISLEALRASLDAVMLGGTVVLPTPMRAFPTESVDCTGIEGAAEGEMPKLDPEAECKKLSDRETEILLRLTKGESNKQIARQFEITEATVKVHLKAILRKIRVSNRTQAAVWAHNNYVARPPRPPRVPLADFRPDVSQGSVMQSKYTSAREDQLRQNLVAREVHRSLRTV